MCSLTQFVDSDRSFKPEGQQRFGGDPDCLAPRETLGRGTRARAGERADCGTFAAAGDGSDDPAQRRTAACEYAGALIRSDTFLALLDEVACLQPIVMARNFDRGDIDRQV